jgi:hypothetical protein
MANSTTITKADGTFIIPFKAAGLYTREDIESNYNYVSRPACDVNRETHSLRKPQSIEHKPIETKCHRAGICHQSRIIELIDRPQPEWKKTPESMLPLNFTNKKQYQQRSCYWQKGTFRRSRIPGAQFAEYRNQFPVASAQEEKQVGKNTPIIFKITITTDSCQLKFKFTKNGIAELHHLCKSGGSRQELKNLDNEEEFVERRKTRRTDLGNKELPTTPNLSMVMM